MNKKVEHTDIVIINDNNMGFLGGERESQLIIINAVRKNDKISVIQPGFFGEKIENVNFYWRTRAKRIKTLIKNPFAFIAYFFKVASLLRKIDPIIVHSNSQVSFFIVSLAKRFRLISRKTILIHTDRGLFVKYNSFFKHLFVFSFKYTDVLVTTTLFNSNCWKKYNGNKKLKTKYMVIGNTAGEMFETIDESKIKKNSFLTVGFAGRMCDWKGWPLAERICEGLKQIDGCSIKMFVSCLDKKSFVKTNLMFERMLRLLGSNRFEGRINVPFNEMDSFYYSIDIFILTSDVNSESFGRTLVEAMSRRTAILTTDAGGAVEVVNDSSTICQTSDDFVNAVKKWNEDRALLCGVKTRNLKYVKDHFSLKNNTQGYTNLYKNLIDISKL